MKYIKKFETKINWNFDDEEDDEEYLIFRHSRDKYFLIGLNNNNDIILLQNINKELVGFTWKWKASNSHDLLEINKKDIKRIQNNEKIITAAGFPHYKYSLSDIKPFMDKNIPIRYL